MPQGFGKDARLSGRAAFDRVFKQGRKLVGGDLLLWAARRGAVEDPGVPGTRLGLSVSRKLGGAVRRNRLKRLLREAFRTNKHRLSPGYDMVVYPRPGCKWKGLADAEGSLMALCRKAGLLQS